METLINRSSEKSRFFDKPQSLYGNYAPNSFLGTLARTRANIAEMIQPSFRQKQVASQYTSDLPGLAWRVRYALQIASARVQLGQAERHSNELQGLLDGQYSEEINEAMRKIPHHGQSHGSRTESAWEIIRIFSPELRLSENVMLAAARHPYEHDANQIYFDNLNRKSGTTYPGKDAHDIGGATMTAALAARYARTLPEYESNPPAAIARAKKISGMAAFMMVAHKTPERLKEKLGMIPGKQMRSVETILEDGGIDLLVKAFTNKTTYALDLTTMRYCDMVAILKIMKQQSGFATPYGPRGRNPVFPDDGQTFVSEYGLGQSFERMFGQELSELATSKTRLLEGVGETEVEQLKEVAILLDIADGMDMVVPQDDTLARTFTVPVSREIPLSWSLATESTPSESTHEEIRARITRDYGASLWAEIKGLSPLETGILDDILYGEGYGSSNDARRKIWEAVNLGRLIEGTPMAKNHTIPRMLDDYGGMAFVHLREVIPLLMSGNQEQIEKYFTEIFNRRIKAIAEKPSGETILNEGWRDELLKERADVISAFEGKPGGIQRYSQDEVRSFLRVLTLAEKAFWIKQAQRSGALGSHATDIESIWYANEQMADYARRYARGERPIAPTRSYDRTGSLEQAKTIRRLAA